MKGRQKVEWGKPGRRHLAKGGAVCMLPGLMRPDDPAPASPRRPAAFSGRALTALGALALAAPAARADLILTGVIDGGLPGGIPKGIELYVSEDIPDLSLYGVGSANNGGGSDGVEFTFPAGGASKGDYLYLGSENGGWDEYFGFLPDYTTGAMAINGDDAIEVFKEGEVIDVFGDINVDGNGTAWEYLDSYAYRVSETGPDGESFAVENWTFGGVDLFDGAGDPAEIVGGVFGTYFPAGDDTPRVQLAVDSPSISEVGGTATISVTVLNPPGGAFTLDVVSDGDGSELNVPETVAVAAGGEGTLVVTAIDDGVLDGPQGVTLTIGGEGFVGAQITITVTDVAVPPAVVINEVYADTAAGDPNGDGISSFDDEFIEVVNGTGAAVDLAGWTLSDAALVRHVFAGGTVLADGEAIVVFNSGNPEDAVTLFGLARVVVASTGTLFLNNGDTVTLANPDGAPVSVYSYAAGDVLPGLSLTRDPDITGGFVLHTAAAGGTAGDFSPGLRVDGSAFPAAGSAFTLTVDIDRFLELPDGGLPAEATATVRRITGQGNGSPLEVTVTSGDPSEATVPETVTIPAGANTETFTISGVDDGEQDGDQSVTVTVSADGFAPASVTVGVFDNATPTIFFPDGSAVVSEDGGTAVVAIGIFPAPATAFTISLASADGGTNLIFPASVAYPAGAAQVTFEVTGVPDGEPDGDDPVTLEASAENLRGNSILVTVTNVDPFNWVINELLPSPPFDGDDPTVGDANGDGERHSTDDEFVEIINAASTPAEIGGWTLSDGFDVRHVFPGGTVVPAGGALVVFGGGNPAGGFGGGVVQTASTGTLGLNNGGDSVTLTGPFGGDPITVEYTGGEFTLGESLTRDPDVTGGFVSHGGVAGALDVYSPGTRTDGSSFLGGGDELDAWRVEHFGVGADPAIAGNAADPDGDGIPNLVEFALGLPPDEPAAGGPAFRPVSAGPAGGRRLGVAFTRPSGGVPGVTFGVEVSGALQSWSAARLGVDYTVSVVDNGDGTENVTVTQNAAADVAPPFLRLVFRAL